jgi:hypothetical protein
VIGSKFNAMPSGTAELFARCSPEDFCYKKENCQPLID